jgi:hypothetical protein
MRPLGENYNIVADLTLFDPAAQYPFTLTAAIAMRGIERRTARL